MSPGPGSAVTGSSGIRRRSVLVGCANMAAVLVIYFAVPVHFHQSVGRLALGLVLTLAGLAVATRVVFREALSWIMGNERRLTGFRLILLLEFMTVAFSLVYFLLATGDHGEMEGLSTRVDALYFTVSTMATVGFGDIHATGQLARAIVTGHMAFDVVFLAIVAGLFRGRLAEAAGARTPGHGEPDSGG